MATSRLCSIPGCGKPLRARGWCDPHWKRWRKYGDPDTMMRPANGATQAYFRDVVLTYDGDDCLTWPFGTTAQGYATLWRVDRKQLVSRLVCEEVYGPPPSPEYQAAHSCGNGHLSCVAKGHLSWKTATSNHADKLIHGTTSRGQRHGNSKLTEADVREIRTLKGTLLQYEIADQFGVAPSLISLIHSGDRWGWLDD